MICSIVYIYLHDDKFDTKYVNERMSGSEQMHGVTTVAMQN